MGSDEGRHLDQPVPYARGMYVRVRLCARTRLPPSSTLRIPNLTQDQPQKT